MLIGLLIFHRDEKDSSFISQIWKEENWKDEDISMNFNEFESFLIHFMQRSFLKCIEPSVTNRRVFAQIGGRDMYQYSKETQFKLEDYELKLLKAQEEIMNLNNEKEMILKQSKETSAKINFMESEAMKEREHIGTK